ncbi:hypothetical protein Pmani_018958 [Petrolisthes manimaculis]|uniref:Uncharacterized protein n=1 Tax=Petrolisthes manimaculis TaxID=1843537 RepID=A0AAE1PLT8_9EUCA|nr:hypothetical protein Pmani_018958 [Petrolisthes manimaculis]
MSGSVNIMARCSGLKWQAIEPYRISDSRQETSLIAHPQVVAVGVVVDSDGQDPAGQDTLRSISCRDLDPECENLANQRECEANPAYMEVACQESCGTCKPQSSVKGCSDQREECPGWGQRGDCDLNPAFMNVNCPLTCNSCPPAGPEDCVDQHEFCFLGSLLGLCRTNPSFYLIFCADSCRRFIPVCVQGEASTVPDLCLSRAQGEEVECGTDPTTAAVKRRKRRHTTLNTTLADLDRGTTMTTTDHLLHTHIASGSASPPDNVLSGNVLTDQVNISTTRDEARNEIPYTNLLHTDIFRAPTTPQGNGLDGHVVEVSNASPSEARDERSRETSYKSKTKLNWDEKMLSVAWSMMMEAMKKGIKWEKREKEEEEEEEESLGNGEWGRSFRWGYRSFTSRQYQCCIDTDDGDEGVVPESPTPTTVPQIRSLNSQIDYYNMLEEVHSDWEGRGSEYGGALHHQYTALDERNTSGTENITLWDERDSVMEEEEGYYRMNEQQGDDQQSLEVQDSSTKVAKKSAVDKTDDNVNEEQHSLKCPSDNEQCVLDDDQQQYLNKDNKQKSVAVHSPHQQSRVKRQIDCSYVDCESLNPCVVYMVTLETSVNLCIIIPPVIFLVFLVLIDWNLGVTGDPPSIPRPVTFTLPPFTPELTPPTTPQPSPPSTPSTIPTTPSTMPTSPSSTSQPTPSTTPLPLPLPEVRIRSLVPYCSGEGYLSLVERLQRLTTGNTGRPLNPIAASLTVAVNHCKYGVGTGDATVGSVPEAPPQLAFPTVTSILLRDREANISLQKPQRWPGLSMPALYLYQPGGQPPPPLTPAVVTPSIPSTNITTVITVTVNGTVVSNTTQLLPGETPTGDEGLPEGGVPEGGVPEGGVPEGGVPGGEGGVPGGEGGVPGGEGVPGDGIPDGPKPVTEESLGSRDSFSCGGALISPYHVLTAAHCLIAPGLTETAVTKFQKPSVVRLGEVDFERVDESQAFDYKVAGVQVHEGYALPAKYNDIAIITLENRVEFTSALRPYCLPQRQDELVGRRCTVSGWGRRPGGQVSTVLHNVEVEVVSREECGSAYLDDTATRPFFEIDYPDGVTPVVLCAGKINNVCRGDSGGPLVLEEAGIQQEVGVVSTGYGCGSVLYPGLYTRIDQFTAWIEAEIYGACTGENR